jgi:hypothetical protein
MAAAAAQTSSVRSNTRERGIGWRTYHCCPSEEPPAPAGSHRCECQQRFSEKQIGPLVGGPIRGENEGGTMPS